MHKSMGSMSGKKSGMKPSAAMGQHPVVGHAMKKTKSAGPKVTHSHVHNKVSSKNKAQK